MKVLYVLASARSGNTVLGRLLGEVDGFFLAGEAAYGQLIEYGPTEEIFTTPMDPRTEDYITGRFG